MARVLVVEDDPSTATIVRYHLDHAGFEFCLARDAIEGWRCLEQGADAAVVDLALPGGDGWSLVERARTHERFRRLPFVLLAGMLEREVLARAAALDCDYLGKPFAATALVRKLRGLLREPDEDGVADLGTTPGGRLVGVSVVLLLDGYQVEGTIHLAPELARFSDAWEALVRDARAFIPVTEASVYPASGGHALASPAFIEVRKQEVRGVFPKDVQPE